MYLPPIWLKSSETDLQTSVNHSKMKNYSTKYSGILLAGGKSSRMGEDKAFMRYGNHFLYEYSLDILKKKSEDILVSSSNPGFYHLNYKIIADEIPGIGPLGGIYSCLKQIKNKYAIILPCDLPMITEKIIDVLLMNSPGYEISIAINDNNLAEPLIGVYSKSLIPIIDKMLGANHYKMQELLKLTRTNFVKIPEVSSEIFRNINSPEEFNSLPPIENFSR